MNGVHSDAEYSSQMGVTRPFRGRIRKWLFTARAPQRAHRPRDPATRDASRASAFFISTERTRVAKFSVHSVSLMLSAVGRKCTSIKVFESPLSESCRNAHTAANARAAQSSAGAVKRKHATRASDRRAHLEQRRKLGVPVGDVCRLLRSRGNHIRKRREGLVDVLRFLHCRALRL
jgi:hypothetical protein